MNENQHSGEALFDEKSYHAQHTNREMILDSQSDPFQTEKKSWGEFLLLYCSYCDDRVLRVFNEEMKNEASSEGSGCFLCMVL